MVLLRQKLLGCKFSRQHPFGIYILDFYCHQLHLAIEVDGNIHLLESVQKNDKMREETLSKLGLQILRFTNEEPTHKQATVFQSITHFILQQLPTSPGIPT
ncbi:endonuclease domain-containing protein [Cnuella takakiae]|uniref:endonuclease domain-containing protein n=1 Tax=Cnuella takakiae TaxID=1302690 RepID=UPI0009F896D2|nr:endonuclease domain-containing protein [Cnuella takakiae]